MGRERKKGSELGRRGKAGIGPRERVRGERGRANFPGLPPCALALGPAPAARNQASRRQVASGVQWLEGVRNLGLNLALPLQGAGPPFISMQRRDEMNMQRGL